MWMPMSLVANLIFSLVIAYLASQKGRSGTGWFFSSLLIGFFFNINILLLIVLLISPNLTEEKTRLAREGSWRRRHHESLEQERNVNRKFRDHVIQRLDRQDQVLGLDPMEVPVLDQPDQPREIVTYPMLGNGTWFLVIDDKEQGPMPEAKVVEMLRKGKIHGGTYAWSEGMQDWQRAGTIGNFSAHC